jgi:hypothetical protein
MFKPIFLYAAFFFMTISSVIASGFTTLSPTPIDPENIYGGVKKINSDRPLKDVTITVIHQNNYHEKYFQTDTNGAFGIDDLLPGTYKLVFQKDGYKKVVKDKVVVKANNAIELQIEMEESGFELGPSPFHFFKF